MAKGDVLVRMKADVSNYDANIAKARRTLDGFKQDNLTLGGILNQSTKSIVAAAAQYASFAAVIGAVGGAITSNIETARGFEKSMSQLSSLTGMVGADLEKLKGYAIELGSSTTLSASQVADAFKMIGSQQPQLLESGEALKAVTKNAITLAEAAGIDLATASQTLSTSINQMGGDSANAERYINVLAAASQKGAGDIAWLGEAITKSGTTAKAVGTDYEELVANLEQLAKAGFDASTAGTALRSIIMNLEKQANKDFKPSIVGLTQAFENLGKANLSIVDYQEIAGKMFASQAKALADAAGEAKNMTAAITGTNTAEEQAKTNTDNLEGSLKALSSAWEGFNLHLNSSNGLFRDIVDGLKDIVVWADNVIVKLGEIPNPENIITNGLDDVTDTVDDNGRLIRKNAIASIPEITVSGTAPKKTRRSGGGGGKKFNPSSIAFNSDKAALAATKGVDTMPSVAAMITPESIFGNTDDWENYKDVITGGIGSIGEKMDNLKEWTKDFDPYADKMKEIATAANQQKAAFDLAAQAAGSLSTALSSMDDPAAQAAGTVISAIANIALGFATASAQAGALGPFGWIAWLAAGAAALATTISTVHSLTGYSEGGIVGGNSYSGDNIFAGNAMLNSGEVVLTRAMAGNLASQLEGNGLGNLNLSATISGEQIRLALNNNGRRTGRGEYVQTNFR